HAYDELVRNEKRRAYEGRDKQAAEALRELLPVHADLSDPAADPADSVAEDGTLRHDVLVACAVSAGDYRTGVTRRLRLVVASGIPTVSENEVLAFVRLPAGTQLTRHVDTGQL